MKLARDEMFEIDVHIRKMYAYLKVWVYRSIRLWPVLAESADVTKYNSVCEMVALRLTQAGCFFDVSLSKFSAVSVMKRVIFTVPASWRLLSLVVPAAALPV